MTLEEINSLDSETVVGVLNVVDKFIVFADNGFEGCHFHFGDDIVEVVINIKHGFIDFLTICLELLVVFADIFKDRVHVLCEFCNNRSFFFL